LSFSLGGTCTENGRAVSLGANSSGGGTGVTASVNCNAGNWTSSWNLSGLNDGTVTFTADHQDAAGLDATQAVRVVTKETVSPVAVIATTASNPTNFNPIPITIEFTETVTGFSAGDFTLENASISNFVAVDGNSYTANLVPTVNGLVSASVGANKVVDLYGNDNTLSNKLTLEFDDNSPTVSISSTSESVTTDPSIALSIEFSESVTGFSKSDISVTNASLSDFTAVSGKIYQVNLKPSNPGEVSASISADVAEDDAGNGNAASIKFSRTYEARSVCSVWNGFFNGELSLVWNILEHVNLGTEPIGISSTLYGLDGTSHESAEFVIEPGQQLDLLVHDMPGWIADSYGLVCSKVTSGNSSSLDGRLVYFARQAQGGFEYIFASPFTDGLAGDQFVGFNTYQPSLNTGDVGNFVANWIQITNLDDSNQKGSLLFYNQEGELLESKDLTIPGKGQSDNSAHDWEVPTVGFVQWQPDSSSARFVMKNTRYLYDNAELENRFDGVFQLQASPGEKGVLSAILDTAAASSILEVANITNAAVNTRARFYDSAGALLADLNFSLPAHASQHIIADAILSDGTGSVLVEALGATVKSLTATVFQYGRNETGSIAYLYGVSALKPVGDQLRSSYNTFLNQSCDIYLANTSSSNQTATISMKRNDGSDVFVDNVVELGPKQSVVSNICAAESQESYGVVTLNAGNSSVINSYLLRKDRNDLYRYPIPVR